MSVLLFPSALLFVKDAGNIHPREEHFNNVGTQKSSMAAFLNPFDLNRESFDGLELGVMFLFLAFCLNFYVGVRGNLRRANSLADYLDEALGSQFEKIGHTSHTGKRLVRDGYQEYWYHASGRIATSSFTARFNLAPRQDMFKTMLGLSESERVTCYIPIDNMRPMSVLILKKSELNRQKDDFDCEALQKAQRYSGEILNGEDINIAGEYTIMTEHRELLQCLMFDQVFEDLKHIQPYLEFLHLSNTKVPWDATCEIWDKLLRIDITLPRDETAAKSTLQRVARMSCNIADTIQKTRISKLAEEKVDRIRKSVREEEEKEKMEERKKAFATEKQLKKKRLEESVSKMTREQQMKHHQRKKKKQFRDSMKKPRK